MSTPDKGLGSSEELVPVSQQISSGLSKPRENEGILKKQNQSAAAKSYFAWPLQLDHLQQ
jgi:hypothetical protein